MTCIIKKKKNGNTYYYAAESKRVNGKPRIIWQKYLGTIDTIIKHSEPSSSPEVQETAIFEAGGVAAMLQIANKIGLIEIIDSVVPKREQGPSVGEYIVLAAINRVMDPCSKLRMPDWYKETVLLRLWQHPSRVFSSQNFWQNMNLIEERDIEEIQEKIAAKIIKTFEVNPQAILYDTSNFFTYIATGNKRNTIARRGKNKQKRKDLRQVGLALLVTKEFHIPLFHKVYEGNLADKGDFPEKARDIERWKKKALGNLDETTMIFDKGNISGEGMEQLIASGQHFTCAVPKTVDLQTFKTNITKFKAVEGLPGTKAYSCEIELWSKKFKAVLSYSESFFTASLADITEKLQKCEKQLRDLDSKLAKWIKKEHHKNKPTFKTVQSSIDKIVTGEMRTLIRVENGAKKGIQRIQYNVDQDELNRMMQEELGRTLVISTRREQSVGAIIKAYRGLGEVEKAFKNMKHKDFLHWQPEFHWTDQKIKVHALYCVIALLLASLAHKTVREANIEISLPAMLEELSKIREVALIYSKTTKQKNTLTISRMSPKQTKLAEILEVHEVLRG